MMHLNVPTARMLGLPRLPAFMNVVLQPLANLLRVERASNGDVAYWTRALRNGDFGDETYPVPSSLPSAS